MTTLEEIVAIARNYDLFPDERASKLEGLRDSGVSFIDEVKRQNFKSLSTHAGFIQTALSTGKQKFILTITATPNTHPKAFDEVLDIFLEKFNGKLYGRHWRRDKKFVRGYISVESLAKDLKTKVPLHAHIVFQIPKHGGKRLVRDIREAARYAAQYPKRRDDVFRPSRVHVRTIRCKRKCGETPETAQKKTARYFTKTLAIEANPNLTYGPGLYILDEHKSGAYGARKLIWTPSPQLSRSSMVV